MELEHSLTRALSEDARSLEVVELEDATDYAVECEPEPPAGAEAVGPQSFAMSLVPTDVLDELHARGEIDLFDPAGNPIHRADELELEVVEEAADVRAVEELFEVSPVERVVDEAELVETLARIPLFRALDDEGLRQLAEGAALKLVGDRSYVFKEGEAAQSFFVVVDGAIEIVRRPQRKEIALAQFHLGEAFGVFGLIAGQRRAASARAIGSAEVVEISIDALSAVMEGYPKVHAAVMRFFEERLLENFLGSSPLFADLSAVARGLLISQFREKTLRAGEKLVSPGEVFNGLFLVISGELIVTKRQGGASEDELAMLSRGHFFGIVSALSGTPCRVQVAAMRDAVVAMLPQRAFNDFVKDYPVLRQLPIKLAEQGLLIERDVFIGQTGIPGLS